MPSLLAKGKVTNVLGEVLNPYQKSVDYLVDIILKEKEVTCPGDKVFLLQAKTGSGKSTILPPYLWRTLYRDNPKKGSIMCTQPRIYNTLAIPVSIAKYNPDYTLGKDLGYITSSQKLEARNGLNFCTIDTLLMRLVTWPRDRFISKYSYIIVDEVHVRNTGLDMLFLQLNAILKANFRSAFCPTLILMSATFDIQKFAAHFGTRNIYNVEGESFPIERHFLTCPVDNTVIAVADKILEIHKANPLLGKPSNSKSNRLPEEDLGSDILVFIFSEAQAKEIIALLEFKTNNSNNLKTTGSISESSNSSSIEYEPFKIVVVLSKTIDEAREEFAHPRPERRIIFGTNAIETGVTIDTLKFVIELGWQNTAEYYPQFNLKALFPKPIDQSSATQRAGRVGRLFPGVVYFMYTEETFQKMRPTPLPDILTQEISDSLLYILVDRFEFTETTLEKIIETRDNIAHRQRLLIRRGKKSGQMNDPKYNGLEKKAFGLTKKGVDEEEDMTNINMLDPPSGESILRGMEILHTVGAVDEDNIPTIMGLLMHKMSTRISMQFRKAILSGIVFDISVKELTLGALMFSNKIHFVLDKTKAKGFNLLEEFGLGNKFYPLCTDSVIDSLMFYHVFKQKIKAGHLIAQKWCDDFGFSYHKIVEAIALCYDMFKTFDTIGFNYEVSSEFKLKRQIRAYNKTNNYDEFLDYIKRWKMCMYQGFKSNVAEFISPIRTNSPNFAKPKGFDRDNRNNRPNFNANKTKDNRFGDNQKPLTDRLITGGFGGSQYRTKNGYMLSYQAFGNPRYILYYGAMLGGIGGQLKYSTKEVSILSGYIGVDEYFY